MNDQALVDVILRVADHSNALNCVGVSAVLEQIHQIEDFQLILDDKGFQEALADARAWRTMSEYRWALERMLLTAVRHISEYCGFTLRWEHPDGKNILLIGQVDVDTHTGRESVWCIRNVFEQNEVEGREWHDSLTNNFFHALCWRSKMPRSTSRYGWTDPAYINRPDTTREYNNQWDIG